MRVKSDSVADVSKEPYKLQKSNSTQKKRNIKRMARSISIFGFSSQTDG